MMYTVHVQPSGFTFTVRENETLLEAALRQGYRFSCHCKALGCSVCKAQLIEGHVEYGSTLCPLGQIEREQGRIIFSLARPCTNLVVYFKGLVGPTTFPLRTLICPVISCENLSGDVFRVLLAQPKEPLIYAAGQYIEILHMDTSPKPFSLACAPDKKTLELHFRSLINNGFTAQLLHEVKTVQQLKLIGPHGAMTYPKSLPKKPLLLVAGGTGFAPFKAIIEQALKDPAHPPIYLYWGVRARLDLYWHAQIEAWAKAHENFFYIPVLSQPQPIDLWKGETGLIHERVVAHHSDLSFFHIYVSGPPEMVYASQKAFLEKGMLKEYFYSDLLDYLPK